MKNEKFVKAITPIDTDFSQWYTDIVKKAELVDYSTVRGCMIIRPYAYAIWEKIQQYLDLQLKDTEHENVYMPMFIPESLLQKEKEHVEGFAPEVAWVTHGGSEQLAERLVVRPTSETLFCEHYSKIINSYNDLPKKYNQWCSVVRWEKTTRPFLRTTEFLWQEGHTVHASAEEAQEETMLMLDTYEKLCKEILAIPVIKGQKTNKEKFSGALATYTIESLMHDGRALQSGTSHNFGDKFSRAFDIKYMDRDSKTKYAFQTSWGVTTRLIGAVIMVHGDNSGLVLPPNIAPIQVVIIPIAMHKDGVLEKATEIKKRLSKVAAVKLDQSDKSPGWKFNEYEMKGTPIRLEVGPKDIENEQVILARRDTQEKIVCSLNNIEEDIINLLSNIQTNLYNKALHRRNEMTHIALNMEGMYDNSLNRQGFTKAMWCGEEACENKIKEVIGFTSRCIPFDQESLSSSCVCCGKSAKQMVIWGKAY